MSLEAVLNDILDQTAALPGQVALESDTTVIPPNSPVFSEEMDTRLEQIATHKLMLDSMMKPGNATKAVATEVFTMLGSINGQKLLSKLTESGSVGNTLLLSAVTAELTSSLSDEEKALCGDLSTVYYDTKQLTDQLLEQALMLDAYLCRFSGEKRTVPVIVEGKSKDLVSGMTLQEIRNTDDTLYFYPPFADKLRRFAAKLCWDTDYVRVFGEDQQTLMDIVICLKNKLLAFEQVRCGDVERIRSMNNRVDVLKDTKLIISLISSQSEFTQKLYALMDVVLS